MWLPTFTNRKKGCKTIKFDKNNPWLVGIIGGIVSGVLSALLVGAIFYCREQRQIKSICSSRTILADRLLKAELPQEALTIYNDVLEILPRKDKHIYAYIQNQKARSYLSLAQKGNEARKNLVKAAIAFEESLKHLGEEKCRQSIFAELELSGVYWNLSWFQEAENNIAKAVELFQDIKRLYPELTHISPFPQLGITPADNLFGSGKEYLHTERFLRTAIQHGEETLKVCTAEKYPIAYGLVQGQLGFYYQALADITDFGTKTANLKKSIEAFTLSLEVFRPDEYPLSHIDLNRMISLAYLKLADVGDKSKNIRHAIRILEEPLKVASLESYPDRYAWTQRNLASSYTMLSLVEDKEENLNKAISCTKEALKFYMADKTPFEYAITQGELGKLYLRLSEIKNKELNIHNTENSFEKALAALKFYTPNKTAPEYSMQQERLGYFYLNLSNIKEINTNLLNAKKHFESALTVLNSETNLRNYQRVKSMLQRIEKRIKTEKESK